VSRDIDRFIEQRRRDMAGGDFIYSMTFRECARRVLRRQGLRLALYVAALAVTITLALALFASHPARADYTDHGEPQTSLVASAHPQTYTGGGGELVRTGSDLGGLVLAGGVCFGIGFAAVLLASRKRTGVRHG
jgi:hypothetical protein